MTNTGSDAPLAAWTAATGSFAGLVVAMVISIPAVVASGAAAGGVFIVVVSEALLAVEVELE